MGRVGYTLAFALLCMTLPASPKGDAAAPSPLEKKLNRYLQNRLLIFRQLDVRGSRVKFNSRGRPVGTVKSDPQPVRTGILYTNLKLRPERLVLMGEPVEVVWQRGKKSLLRDPHILRMMTCTVILDVPPDQLDFPNVIALLARVFLTKPELDEIARRSADGGK